MYKIALNKLMYLTMFIKYKLKRSKYDYCFIVILYISIYIYLTCLIVCLTVCLYPINVKIAVPIRFKLFVATHLTQEEVYGPSNLPEKKCSHLLIF